jgi:glycosyltransferase involved in cell wall biosynthesis
MTGAASAPVLRVAHVITGLATGGAEMMLQKLVARSHGNATEHVVFPLQPGGELTRALQELGVTVEPVGMRAGIPDPRAVFRLARLLERSRADVVQTWLYHGDLVGGLAARLAGIPVVWGVHHSVMDPASTKRATQAVRRVCALLSARIPRAIIACSQSSVTAHVGAGYSADRFVVVPNGFDLERFRPAPEARQRLRNELGISRDADVVGHVARWDPNKDYPNLINAAQRVLRRRPATHFVLAGNGISDGNRELAAHIAAAGIGGVRIHLLGRRADVPALMAGFDVLCQSSSSEAFPSVIGEAMACTVPCAVTDVGDSRLIVGDTGRLAPARDAAALAEAILSLLALDADTRRELGRRARDRIAENYSVDSVVGQYIKVYEGFTNARPPGPP